MIQLQRKISKPVVNEKKSTFFPFNSFIFDPVSCVFNTSAMSFELAAQGMMPDRRTERAGVWCFTFIPLARALAWAQVITKATLRLLSWFTPGKIQPWTLTHMPIQLHLPLLSLWGDQLGMLISWKWCPQWSIQHSSIRDMFNMWSSNEAQEAFSSIHWTLSCSGSTLFSIIRLSLLLKSPPDLHGLGWHSPCQVFASGCTYTGTQVSVHRYNLGGGVRFHVEQFSCFPGQWWKGWAQSHPKHSCHPKQLQSPDIPTNFNAAPSHFWSLCSLIVTHCSATFCTLCIHSILPVPRTSLASCNFWVQLRSLFLSATILWIYTSFPMTLLKHESITAVAQDWWQMTGLCWGQEGRAAQRYKTLW